MQTKESAFAHHANGHGYIQMIIHFAIIAHSLSLMKGAKNPLRNVEVSIGASVLLSVSTLGSQTSIAHMERMVVFAVFVHAKIRTVSTQFRQAQHQ